MMDKKSKFQMNLKMNSNNLWVTSALIKISQSWGKKLWSLLQKTM